MWMVVAVFIKDTDGSALAVDSAFFGPHPCVPVFYCLLTPGWLMGDCAWGVRLTETRSRNDDDKLSTEPGQLHPAGYQRALSAWNRPVAERSSLAA
jgi:hypothetical protein